MGLHHIALRVTDIIPIAVGVGDPDHIARGGANAHGENFQTGLRRITGRVQRTRLAVVVLAVG